MVYEQSAMKKRIDWIRIIFFVPFMVFRYTNRALFAWWLPAMLQRKSDEKLWEDVQAEMPFLSKGVRRLKDRVKSLPMDYASVFVSKDCVVVEVVRGEGEALASVRSETSPEKRFLLSRLLAAINNAEHRGKRELFLSTLDSQLQQHWPLIRQLISDSEQARAVSQAYDQIAKDERNRTVELQWRLNQHLQSVRGR